MSISEIAVKRPLLILTIFTVLILFGALSYQQLSYNLLPKFEANVISVVTTYRGASADEVETNVTKRIEEALSALEGLDRMTSTSQEGASSVIIQLKNGVNTTLAQQDAQRKIEQIINLLPDEADRPILNKFSTDEIPVLRMGVTAEMSPSALYDLIDNDIKPQLSNVSGVGQVNIIGGNEREIQVNVNTEKLRGYGISIGQVSQAINAANTSYPAGQLETRQSQYSIRFDASVQTINRLRDLIVARRTDGSQVLLKDVAEVVDATTKPTAINHINARPSIGLQIQKQSDANAVSVSQGAQIKIAQLEKQYSKVALKFNIASDQSIYTLASAHAVVEDMGLAVLIVSLVMLLFLHSFRSALFVLVALPSSMIPTFALMYIMGFSLNLMTLMALSLVVGILVDDSIVVLENINRHLEMGKDKRQAALDGRSEIGFTALAITLVDVVVFVPLAMTGGLIGNILREFALVVVFSTLMSLLVSFTLTPLLASRFGKIEVLNPKTLWGGLNLGFERFLDRLTNAYGTILVWVLGHKRYVFLGVIALLVGSIALVPAGFIGGAFMPQSDQGEMSVQVELAPTASIYQTNTIAQRAEQIIMKHPEVTNVFTNVGYSSNGLATSSNSNLADINIKLIDKKQRKLSTEAFGQVLKQEVSQIPGVKVTVSPVGIVGASQAPIMIAVKGTKLADIRKAAALVRQVTASVPGTQDVKYSVKDPKPEVTVNLNRERMAQLGISASDVGLALQNAFRGNDLSKFKQNGNEYDILVSLDQFDRTQAQDVSHLSFVNNQGKMFELSQFATVQEQVGESVLERIDRLSSITINAQVVGRPVGTVGTDIQTKMAQQKLPEGVSIQYLGQLQQQSDAFGSLGLALMIAILLVYFIMVALYESVVYPFVVLFSIPVALVGALLALALTMESLTVFSIVGMIMLLGLVAKNAILIVDFTNQLKAEGHEVVEALIEAGKERLRPILMTTLAMILGMLPIALASGAGAETKNGMAWVIIGGLTSSLVLTLLVVPSTYLVVDRLIARFTKKKVTPKKPQELEVAKAMS
ncbi:efflux RND transporter permease subunit [Spirosoma utsteinense]|uniref:HAE1 family hydrophobic/amphiphilic exporter-1 n=1 Tax=Spirosoma utsteinense TaxID=2585773 RepID=A0ABR6W6H3_9BACT|nr:efflux RND transporter permease subunit [Spirosoma utsteinense]MBC3787894.1 HAE1 family hydrophobic/amphiphilic exporter-1 [Spirosoma utsteinense]MBC3792185.1 HAE1 family hydrophobic/amphiphilic exporter-1 [Spirosoma utsteinense]